MNEKIILKAEKQGKEKGFSGALLFDYLQGYSDGFNNFKKAEQHQRRAKKEPKKEKRKPSGWNWQG